MPVGNDVVDLGHPLCQPDSIHRRFDSRAFSADEIAYLAAAADPHGTRWALWAAKESAFKAARQLDFAVRFIPRDFAVRLRGKRAAVTHHVGRFQVWFDRTDEWLHAVAGRSGEKPGFRVAAISSAGAEEDPAFDGERSLEGGPAVEHDHSSRQVRRLARGAMGEYLNLAPSEIRIIDVDRIPRARHLREHRHDALEPARPLPVDLSLSHDGRFVACAWAPSRNGSNRRR